MISSIYFDIQTQMMSAQDKKMKEVVRKKIAPINPIKAKCCVCNNFFNTQSQLDLHLLLHQSKLNRTSIDELQRRTQQSFRSKKQPSSLMRTMSGKPDKSEKKEKDLVKQSKQKNAVDQSEDLCGEQQEQNISQALRQSQILLEKIEFLTQIAQPAQQQYIPAANMEQEQDEKTIENEHALYLQLCSLNNSSAPETLIIKTNFEEQYLGNYQQQLRHLKKMMKGETNLDNIAKLTRISKSISSNVLNELKQRFRLTSSKRAVSQNEQEIITSSQNVGQVAYCSLCYTEISCGSSYLHSQLGTIYHKECYEQQQ